MFGVELRIHFTFLLLLVFVWMTESATHGPTAAGRTLGLVGIILASVLLHELGHALVAVHSGIPARSIILLPIGGITLMEDSRETATAGRGTAAWSRDIYIALAGPLVNLLVAFVAGSVVLSVAPEVGLWSRPYVHSNNLLRSLVWGNLYLAGFNLLPAYPLDGGRILRALISSRMDVVQATRRAVNVGQGFAILFMFVGMVWNIWLVLIGFFVFIGAQLEERSAVFHAVLEKVSMEDVMLTDFATLSPADTLEDALHKAVHSLQDDFPVVRGSDMVGVISKEKILHVLRAHGNGYVQAAMNQVYEVAQRSESLASAFRKISNRGLTLIPVVEDQRLVGIVTLQNLTHSMALLAETRRLQREAMSR